ncbi:MAG: NAD(P)/FAD-dependent oxidoreductase [Pseudomonadota bacterium]
MDFVESCVIGAGVVGLAIGRALAALGHEVVVLDAQTHFGQGVSSRNSEVIHAGIYYPAGSLKATLCVEGKRLLYEYCRARGISHANCGKLIVATTADEEASLEAIRHKALANDVCDLEYLSAARVKSLEPAVSATLALYSPSTGIVSSHELMQAFLSDLTNNNGTFVGDTSVTALNRVSDGYIVTANIQGSAYRFRSRMVVNAAGLGAQAVAAGADFIPAATIPPLYYCKGNYFTLAGRNPFSHLIYPVPEKSGAGLGVHATIDLGGQARFGPDVEYIDREDYNVNLERLPDYYAAVRRYFPALKEGDLIPGYVGIRPKLQGPTDDPVDFVIQGKSVHGAEGLVLLYGIESPGLTASLAIANHVCNLLDEG